MLTASDRQLLLQVARESICAAVEHIAEPARRELPPHLGEPAGAFVTLHEDDALRGCIGYIHPMYPLVETVRRAAATAALEDPRFLPVTAREIPLLAIEISVLSPVEKIDRIDRIEIGTHGLIIEARDHRGLLLPQVATEMGWDRETFLNQTARKAGLPINAWKDPDAKIFVFTAEVFGEKPASVTLH